MSESENLNLSEENFQELTQKILHQKSLGNEKYKNQENSMAEDYYKNAISEGENFFKSIPNDQRKNLGENNTYYKKFLNELKNSYSNLAAVYLRLGKNENIIELDNFILNEIDPFFDKSFARIITAYEKMDQMDNAENYFLMMQKRFNRDTMKKYDEQLKNVEISSRKKLENLRRNYEKNKPGNTSFFESWKFKVIQSLIMGLIYFGYIYYYRGSSASNKTNDLEGVNSIKNSSKNFDVNIENNNVNLENLKDEDLKLELTPEKNEGKKKEKNEDDEDFSYNLNENKEKEDI